MPWVKFTTRFDYRVKHNVMISYKAGGTYLVKQECADLAIAAKKAALTERPAMKDRLHAGR